MKKNKLKKTKDEDDKELFGNFYPSYEEKLLKEFWKYVDIAKKFGILPSSNEGDKRWRNVIRRLE